MEVFAKYSNFETNEVDILPTIVSYLESSFGLPATADGPLEIFDFMNAPEFASLAAWSNVDDNQPRAFLNYIVFDDNFQVQDFGVQQVGEEAEIPLDGSAMTHPHQKLTLDVTIEKQGYIYVYLSVDDRQNMDVYWDDFKVTHHLNDIVAGGDYYPFGSVMAGREITRDDYRFGYQGQFSEFDEETGWNAFELRMYDPVIGRWMAVDPYGQYSSPYLGMGNSPINLFDPNGGFTGGDDKFPTETVAGVEGILLDNVDFQYEIPTGDPFYRVLQLGIITEHHGRMIKYKGTISYEKRMAAIEHAQNYVSPLMDLAFIGIGGTMAATLATPMVLGNIGDAFVTVPVISSEINAVTTYGYIWLNGKLVAGAGIVSLGISKFAMDVLRSPRIRAIRIHHSWTRGAINALDQAAQNLSVLPKRTLTPELINPTSEWGAILPLFKSTPE